MLSAYEGTPAGAEPNSECLDGFKNLGNLFYNIEYYSNILLITAYKHLMIFSIVANQIGTMQRTSPNLRIAASSVTTNS